MSLPNFTINRPKFDINRPNLFNEEPPILRQYETSDDEKMFFAFMNTIPPTKRIPMSEVVERYNAFYETNITIQSFKELELVKKYFIKEEKLNPNTGKTYFDYRYSRYYVFLIKMGMIPEK